MNWFDRLVQGNWTNDNLDDIAVWATGLIRQMNSVVSLGGPTDGYDRLLVRTYLEELSEVKVALEKRGQGYVIDFDLLDPDVLQVR